MIQIRKCSPYIVVRTASINHYWIMTIDTESINKTYVAVLLLIICRTSTLTVLHPILLVLVLFLIKTCIWMRCTLMVLIKSLLKSLMQKHIQSLQCWKSERGDSSKAQKSRHTVRVRIYFKIEWYVQIQRLTSFSL